jgi:protein TonB
MTKYSVLILFYLLNLQISLPFSDDDEYFNSEISFIDYDEYPELSYIKLQQNYNDTLIVKTLSQDSILLSIEKFVEKHNKSIPFGESIYYYKNGLVRAKINYNENGKYDKELISYYLNNQMKRHDYYSNGKLDSGKCYDIDGNEIPHFPYKTEPYLDLNLLSKVLVYPEKLRRVGNMDKIRIKVFYDYNGTPLIFKFNKFTKQEFIDEIIRVLTSYNLYTPPKVDGEPFNLWIVIPIQFRLRN